MTGAEARDELTLAQINRQLAELLDVEALPLECGGGRALADTLWVWGVVGGKDVGKSTLINALAGGDVVDRGEDVGEGTFVPSAYHFAEDAAALATRLAGLEDLGVRYLARAPRQMRGLVLVDLPDFDSLFTQHLAAVRRIAGTLDGIIWVTTPKKVGDLRGIAEIDRILKARGNFAYVVNKMDWLIAQSDQPPQAELSRTADALRRQVTACDADDARTRSYLISARFRTRETLKTAIAQQRAANPASLNGAVEQAIDLLLQDFDALRTRLTTAPTPDALDANKRANLAYQLKTQAARMHAHYQPEAVGERLDRALADDAVEELATRYFSNGYCAAVLRRLNSADVLGASWTSAVFRRRIARWPLLGAIAWPLMAIGAALSGMRALLPRFSAPEAPEPFRQDGVGLAERAEGLIAGLRARVAGLGPRMIAAVPASEEVERLFRSDAHDLADGQREAVRERVMRERGGGSGRALRGVLTLGILLWFPFIQPVLAAWLATTGSDGIASMAAAKLVVQSLSGGAVLAGLCVSGLLLAGLTGAVYARAVGDAYRAIDELRSLADGAGAESLGAAVVAVLLHDLRTLRAQLDECNRRLAALATGGAGENFTDGRMDDA